MDIYGKIVEFGKRVERGEYDPSESINSENGIDFNGRCIPGSEIERCISLMGFIGARSDLIVEVEKLNEGLYKRAMEMIEQIDKAYEERRRLVA